MESNKNNLGINVGRNEKEELNNSKNKLPLSSKRRQVWWDEEIAMPSASKFEKTGEISPSLKPSKFASENGVSRVDDISSDEVNMKDDNATKNLSILILTKDFLQESTTQYLYVLLIQTRYIILPCFLVLFFSHTYFLVISYFIFNGVYFLYILMIKPVHYNLSISHKLNHRNMHYSCHIWSCFAIFEPIKRNF